MSSFHQWPLPDGDRLKVPGGFGTTSPSPHTAPAQPAQRGEEVRSGGCMRADGEQGSSSVGSSGVSPPPEQELQRLRTLTSLIPALLEPSAPLSGRPDTAHQNPGGSPEVRALRRHAGPRPPPSLPGPR